MSKDIPRFEKGQRLRASDLQSLANAVAQILRNSPGFGYGIPVIQYCKLESDLAAATSANYNTSSAPTATVSIWHADTSDGTGDSGTDETVRNRTDIAYASGTHGFMMWCDSEWVFFGNCNPF